MGLFSKILKPISKGLGAIAVLDKVMGSGKKSAKAAESAANRYAEEARRDTAANKARTDKERKRAQKLAIRGMRSRRSASFFQNQQETQTQGSSTIG